MARKRLISPEFFMHAGLFDAEEASGLPLRLAFAGIWCQTDRRGVFRWRPRELKLAVLPYDDVDFERVLAALADHDFVRPYSVDGRRYGFIPSFERWQTFHRNERQSDDPAAPPEVGSCNVLASKQTSGWIPREVRAQVIARDEGKCVDCGSVENVTLYHRTPYSEGGEHTVENLRLLCRKCSCKEGKRSLQGLAKDAMTPVTVTGTGTGTGTGTKPPVPRRASRSAAAGSKRDTWLTPLCEAHESVYGVGSFGPMAGRFAKSWRKLVEVHGGEKCGEVWKFSQRDEDRRRFLTPEYVAGHFSEFDPRAPAFPEEDAYWAEQRRQRELEGGK